MSRIFQQVLDLIQQNAITVSAHGYDELAADELRLKDIIAGVSEGVVIENYPNYSKGACVLVLQHDLDQEPIHAVWGIPKDASSPAILITAYRANPYLWTRNVS